jgi:uncharacterized protein YutE (UPF0331/DUF86 family)
MKEQKLLTQAAAQKLTRAISLVEASLDGYAPYDPHAIYTPKELEPYDALSDRFVRAVETALKFFRSYERYLYAPNSDTIRDLLNGMEKLDLITSTDSWIAMRGVRNRVVHDTMPEKIANLYEEMVETFGTELQRLKAYLGGSKFLLKGP